MTIQVNGEPLEIDTGAGVLDLLERLGLAGKFVAVERNRVVVSFRKFAETFFEDGDVVEVVTLVGGG
ncbi:MAG: sulfur carrier protein ThiS [Planctomycetaceae bacterium]|jgi:sulfur carrier protein|nr:sulfur carrier protein ThiS [Planctomycetaceae bacterium]